MAKTSGANMPQRCNIVEIRICESTQNSFWSWTQCMSLFCTKSCSPLMMIQQNRGGPLNVWANISLQPPLHCRVSWHNRHLQCCHAYFHLSVFFPGIVWYTTRDIDMESTRTNNEMSWLRSVKKYFCFGVPTSDPLLNAAKLIAYATEVSLIFPQKKRTKLMYAMTM